MAKEHVITNFFARDQMPESLFYVLIQQAIVSMGSKLRGLHWIISSNAKDEANVLDIAQIGVKRTLHHTELRERMQSRRTYATWTPAPDVKILWYCWDTSWTIYATPPPEQFTLTLVGNEHIYP